jgi:hypothetical protein
MASCGGRKARRGGEGVLGIGYGASARSAQAEALDSTAVDFDHTIDQPAK